LSEDEGLRDIVVLFLEDGRRRLAALLRQQSELDLPGMCSTAHAIKGASANIHAERVRSHAAAIEELTRDQEMPPIPLVERLIEQLAAEFAALDAWVCGDLPTPWPPGSVR
jgi:HPt (histidine-containing phosphotransfer) domain-containing protein